MDYSNWLPAGTKDPAQFEPKAIRYHLPGSAGALSRFAFLVRMLPCSKACPTPFGWR